MADSAPLLPAAPVLPAAPLPGADVVHLVHDFPQDETNEVFARTLKKNYHCKKLRAACTQLGLHPQANPSVNHKEGYILLLSQYRRARERGEVFSGFSAKSRPKSKQKKRYTADVEGRTKHCGFRLVNVAFSGALFPRMVESGALPSTGLALDPVDGRAKYWRDVALAFAEDNPDLDRIAGLPGRYEGIDPRLAPHHSPAKLCAIWKDMTARYEESFTRWKQMGTEEAGFAHFCGDLDVLYLHDRLQMQPIQVDPEQVRAVKRARTGDGARQESESASVDAESDEEKEPVDRRNFLSPLEVEAATEQPPSIVDGAPDAMFRRILPNPSAGVAPTQRRNLPASNEMEMPPQPSTSKTLEERILAFLETERAEAQRRRDNASMYDGVKYASQAVRDAQSAITALKQGAFDRAVIAQAEESLDAIVRVWLGELDKAARPASNW